MRNAFLSMPSYLTYPKLWCLSDHFWGAPPHFPSFSFSASYFLVGTKSKSYTNRGGQLSTVRERRKAQPHYWQLGPTVFDGAEVTAAITSPLQPSSQPAYQPISRGSLPNTFYYLLPHDCFNSLSWHIFNLLLPIKNLSKHLALNIMTHLICLWLEPRYHQIQALQQKGNTSGFTDLTPHDLIVQYAFSKIAVIESREEDILKWINKVMCCCLVQATKQTEFLLENVSAPTFFSCSGKRNTLYTDTHTAESQDASVVMMIV